MQNTFSQSGNDSKWFLKKSFFKIGIWHSRPPRDPPPFMANAILNFHFDFLTPSLRGHGSRVILPCCNQSNQSVSRLISVPAAVKVDQEESVEFCDSHSSSAPFEPNVIWRLHTNPCRGKRLYPIQCINCSW